MFLVRGALPGLSISASKGRLFTRDFVDSVLVTSTFEFLIQPGIGNCNDCFEWDETCRHDKNIRIVVLLDEFADLHRPAETCADALMFVEGHLHSVACAAECYSKIYFAVLDSSRELVSHIRIVHARCCVSAEIDHFVTLASEVFYKLILVFHARVVIAYSDFHESFELVLVLQRYAPKCIKKRNNILFIKVMSCLEVKPAPVCLTFGVHVNFL